MEYVIKNTKNTKHVQYQQNLQTREPQITQWLETRPFKET
jgi:hypothetical protein